MHSVATAKHLHDVLLNISTSVTYDTSIQIVKIDTQLTSMEPITVVSSDEMESLIFTCIIERSPCKFDPNEIRDHEGRSMLHHVVVLNLKEETELLLQVMNPNVADNEGQTPLHVVTNHEIAELLLRHGADPNARDKYGRTPLHYAQHKVAELLIRYGADPNVRDVDGNTPLHFAKSKELVELLLRHGTDPNVKNRKNLPPIYNIAQRDCEAALILLDRSKRDVLLAKDEDGETLLHVAARSGCKELVERLDLDVDVQNKDGNTALHISAIYNHAEIARILLEKGADPFKRNKHGTTPLTYMALAVREGVPFTDAIKLVLQRFDVRSDIMRYAFNTEQLKLLKLLCPNLENLQI